MRLFQRDLVIKMILKNTKSRRVLDTENVTNLKFTINGTMEFVVVMGQVVIRD